MTPRQPKKSASDHYGQSRHTRSGFPTCETNVQFVLAKWVLDRFCRFLRRLVGILWVLAGNLARVCKISKSLYIICAQQSGHAGAYACVGYSLTRSPEGSKVTSGNCVLLSVHTCPYNQPLQWLSIQVCESSCHVQHWYLPDEFERHLVRKLLFMMHNVTPMSN